MPGGSLWTVAQLVTNRLRIRVLVVGPGVRGDMGGVRIRRPRQALKTRGFPIAAMPPFWHKPAGLLPGERNESLTSLSFADHDLVALDPAERRRILSDQSRGEICFSCICTVHFGRCQALGPPKTDGE